MILDDPALDPEAWFVALHNGRWIGMSNLWLNDAQRQRLDVGLTGTLRPFRRQGVATALKLHTIRFGQRIGAATLETSNAEHNPMYALNLKLGFQARPAWLSYRAPFTTAASHHLKTTS